MIWLWRKDSNFRMAALTVRCLTNLATPHENWLREHESNLPMLAYETTMKVLPSIVIDAN